MKLVNGTQPPLSVIELGNLILFFNIVEINMVYISPHGGLCNMMRTVLAAKDICDSIGEELSIFWGYTIGGSYEWRRKELPLRWDEIFSNNIADVVYQVPNNVINYRNTPPYYEHNKDLVTTVYLDELSTLSKNNNVIIESWGLSYNDVGVGGNLNYNRLNFRDEYHNIVDSLNVTKDTIGVHIRRSDFVTSGVKLTPIEYYVDAITKEISENNDANFFIATDDIDVENMLVDKFGDRIITYKKNNYDRVSKEYTKTGIVDLLALSRCKTIYGSVRSSFSTTASYIGNNKLILEKQ
jgi:hypothetical protein